MSSPAVIPDRKCLDYAWFRPPDDGWLKANGFTDVIRYVAPDNSQTHGKILFKDEHDALVAGGLRVGTVWEVETARPLRGFSVGYDDAMRHMQHLVKIGFGGDALYWAYDQDGSYDQCAAYGRGYAEAVRKTNGPIKRIGCYGPVCALRGLYGAGYIQLPWQTCSDGFCGWENKQTWERTVLHQHCYSKYDVNDVYAQDIGTWNPNLEEDDVTPEQDARLKRIEAMLLGTAAATDPNYRHAVVDARTFAERAADRLERAHIGDPEVPATPTQPGG